MTVGRHIDCRSVQQLKSPTCENHSKRFTVSSQIKHEALERQIAEIYCKTQRLLLVVSGNRDNGM
jgi:hypothetical protein